MGQLLSRQSHLGDGTLPHLYHTTKQPTFNSEKGNIQNMAHEYADASGVEERETLHLKSSDSASNDESGQTALLAPEALLCRSVAAADCKLSLFDAWQPGRRHEQGDTSDAYSKYEEHIELLMNLRAGGGSSQLLLAIRRATANSVTTAWPIIHSRDHVGHDA